MIVAKFGGSSMADAIAMRRSAKVTKDHSDESNNIRIVVVSATYGTTNDLVELATKAPTSPWSDCKPIYQRIEERHLRICEELNAPEKTIRAVKKLLTEAKMMSKGMNYLKDCSPKAYDSLVSVGERISSTLFVLAMQEVYGSEIGIEWFDAREVIKTDEQYGRALPELGKIAKLAKEKLIPIVQNKIVITQGFIGSNEEGVTTTLGRGGSDYSAALLAEAVNATELQIWTDVPGIATTDPRICKNAKPINEISFTEAAELATFGAKILHPTTVWPTMRKQIPIFVGSSIDSGNAGERQGTWVREAAKETPLVRAIALREKQTIITITTPRMVSAYGYLADIFSIFKRHKTPVDLVTTSEISVSLTVHDQDLLNKELLDEVNALGQVTIENDLSLVSLIGNNINHTSGFGREILNSVGDINVRLLSSGASKHNFCFLVDRNHANLAIEKLHEQFLEN